MNTNARFDDWFVREVLPLEPVVVRFLRKNWHDSSEIDDLKQETYVRICGTAIVSRPTDTAALLSHTLRNLLVEKRQKDGAAPIRFLADVENLPCASEEPSPEHTIAAREDMVHLLEAVRALPARCRMAMVLHKLHCLPLHEVAARMNIRESTVEQHLTRGMHILAQSVANRRGEVISQSRRYLGRRKD